MADFPTLEDFRADDRYTSANDGQRIEYDRKWFTGAEDYMSTQYDDWSFEDTKNFASTAQENELISDRTLPGSIYNSMIGQSRTRSVQGLAGDYLKHIQDEKDNKEKFTYPTQEEYNANLESSSFWQQVTSNEPEKEAMLGVARSLRDFTLPWFDGLARLIEEGNYEDEMDKETSIKALQASGYNLNEAQEIYQDTQMGSIFDPLMRATNPLGGTEFVRESAKNFEVGSINAGFTMAGAAASWMGFDNLSKAFRGLKESEKKRLGMTDKERKEANDFDFTKLFSPTYWKTGGAETMGGSLTAMAPAVAAGLGATALLPGTLSVGATLVAGTILRSPFESLTESMFAYEDELAASGDKERAAIAGHTSFVNNFVITSLANSGEGGMLAMGLNVGKHLVPKPMRKLLKSIPQNAYTKWGKIIGGVVAAGGMEGYQEVAQGHVQGLATQAAESGQVAFDIDGLKNIMLDTMKNPLNMTSKEKQEFSLGAIMGSGMHASTVGAATSNTIKREGSNPEDPTIPPIPSEEEISMQYEFPDVDISNRVEVLENVNGLDTATAREIAELEDKVLDLQAGSNLARMRGDDELADSADKQIAKISKYINKVMTLPSYISGIPISENLNLGEVRTRQKELMAMESMTEDESSLLLSLDAAEIEILNAKMLEEITLNARSKSGISFSNNVESLARPTDIAISREQVAEFEAIAEELSVEGKLISAIDDIKKFIDSNEEIEEDILSDTIYKLKDFVDSGIFEEIDIDPNVAADSTIKRAIKDLREFTSGHKEFQETQLENSLSDLKNFVEADMRLEVEKGKTIIAQTQEFFEQMQGQEDIGLTESALEAQMSEEENREQTDLLINALTGIDRGTVENAMQEDGTLDENALLEAANELGIIKDSPSLDIREYSDRMEIISLQSREFMTEKYGDQSLDSVRKLYSDNNLSTDMTTNGADSMIEGFNDINNIHLETAPEISERQLDGADLDTRTMTDVDLLIHDTSAILSDPLFRDADYLDEMMPEVMERTPSKAPRIQAQIDKLRANISDELSTSYDKGIKEADIEDSPVQMGILPSISYARNSLSPTVPTQTPDFLSSTDPEVQARQDAKMSFDRPGFVKNISETWDNAFNRIKQGTRQFKELPADTYHGQAIEILIKEKNTLERAQAKGNLQVLRMVDKLSWEQKVAVERKLYLDGVRAGMEKGELPPWGYSLDRPEVLDADIAKVDEYIKDDPIAQNFLRERAEFNKNLFDDLVKFDILPDNEMSPDNYIKHIVKENMMGDAVIADLTGTGKPSFTKGRIKVKDQKKMIGKFLRKDVSDLGYNTIQQLLQEEINSLNENTSKKSTKRIEKANGFINNLGERPAQIDPNFNYLESETTFYAEAIAAIEISKGKKQLMHQFDIRKDITKLQRQLNKDVDKEARLSEIEVLNGYLNGDFEIDMSNASLALLNLEAENKVRLEKGKDPVTISKYAAEPGNRHYKALTLSQKLSEVIQGSFLEGEPVGITKDMFKEGYVLGANEIHYIPETLGSQLNSMGKPESGARELANSITGPWKKWILNNPLTVMGYNYRNILGDSEFMFTASASPARLPVDMAKSAKMLWDYYRGKTLKADPRLQEALDQGAIDGGMFAGDIPDNNIFKLFKKWMPETVKLTNPLAWPKAYFDAAQKLSVFRENTYRFAYYMNVKRGLDSGKVFAHGSNGKIIASLNTNSEKAARMTRDGLGDYSNLSEFGDMMRTYVMPFFSYTEINTKRWTNLGHNTARLWSDTSKSAGVLQGTKVAGALTAGWAIRMGTMAGMAHLWSLWQAGDDYKDKQDRRNRNQPTLNWTDDNGNIVTLSRWSGIGEVAEWAGLADVVESISEGRYSDVAPDIGKAFVNKSWQMLNPAWKGSIEMTTGLSTFPDVFRPSQANKLDLLANSVGVRQPLNWLRKVALDHGKSNTEGYWKKLLMGAAPTNPRKNARNEVYYLKNKFLKSKGKENTTIFPESMNKDLRAAVMNNDRVAYENALRDRRLEWGETPSKQNKGYLTFLKSMDPLYRMPPKLKKEFLEEFLTPVEQKKLRLGREYAMDMANRGMIWYSESSTE